MHALFVQVTIDPARTDEAEALLHSETVPRVKQAPGFVSGTWMRAADGSRGQSVLLFESADAAQATAERIPSVVLPDGPVTIASTEVFEVLAQA